MKETSQAVPEKQSISAVVPKGTQNSYELMNGSSVNAHAFCLVYANAEILVPIVILVAISISGLITSLAAY